MNARIIGGWLVLMAAMASSASPTWAGGDPAATATARNLVADAMQAEVAGSGVQRNELLAEAVKTAPDFELARWYSGQLRADGDWRSIQDVQQAAATDPRRAEYISLRQSAGDSFDGQLALARWCRKHGFDEEANFHWRTVLTFAPNNDEALKALGSRWYYGRLLTFAEIEAAKKQQQESRRDAKKFEPRVAEWQRLLAAGDIVSRDKALAEIRAIDDADAIPAVEDITLNSKLNSNAKFERAMQMGLALVAALDKLPNQLATESLVRHAVYAPISTVREAAMAALESRSPHDYVPLLLSGLSMPIESSYRVTADSDGSVHYWHSLYREGQHANYSFEGRISAMQMDLQARRLIKLADHNDELMELPAATDPVLQAQMAATATANRSRFNQSGSQAERQVAGMNAAIESQNELIYPILARTTKQTIGSDPAAWWQWWNLYNEYGSEGETPEYEYRYSDTETRYYREPGYAGRYHDNGMRATSCFAAGTLVWTKTGQRPIEDLEIGDLVLSQDVNTGELAYKPIIGRTVRPPSPSLKFTLEGTDGNGEVLHTTLGHPLWVAGTGWRMAKELGDGAILHGVDGPVRVKLTEKMDEIEAYNLVVADFSTYFVGQSGVFVHDNTPRTPTAAKVPGMINP